MNNIQIVSAAKISLKGLDDLNQGFHSWHDLGLKKCFEKGIFTWNGLLKGYRTIDPFCMLALSCVNHLYDGHSEPGRISPEGIILGSYTGCLLTDIKYYLTTRKVDGQKASPGLFRYTLPSIAAGEICIAHQIKGVNIFMTAGHVSGLSAVVQGAELIARKRLSNCLVGGVEVDCPEIRNLLPFEINGDFQSTAYFLLLNEGKDYDPASSSSLSRFKTYFKPDPSVLPSRYLGNQGMEELFQLLKRKKSGKNSLNFISFDGHGVELEIQQALKPGDAS